MKRKETYYQKNTRVNAVFPNALVKRITKYVEKKEVSRNQLYIQAITEYLDKKETKFPGDAGFTTLEYASNKLS